MTEIDADNLPGKVMAPAAAYLTDQYTNRDIFGVVRGKCTEVIPPSASTQDQQHPQREREIVLFVQCKDCGEYWKATADYTVSAGDTGVSQMFVSVICSCYNVACGPR